MLQYANSFTCTVNENKNTVVIHFKQNEPIFPDNDVQNMDFATHDIASLVLDYECAQQLIVSLASLMPDTVPED